MFDEFGRGLESGSYEIVDALKILVRKKSDGHNPDINPHRHVAVQISQAMSASGSIDEFVERHRDNEKYAECAKIAIAKSILHGERNSTLYVEDRVDSGDIVEQNSGTWMSMFLRDLTRRLSRSEIQSAFDNLFVINFNYDRCFIYFTYHWLKRMYGLSDSDSALICRSIKTFHPYGKIGELPFENPAQNVSFGAKALGDRLLAISNCIRTYSEASEDSYGLSAAHIALGDAAKVVFLGFAFHEQNMDILTVPEHFQRATIRCYGTTKDISAPRLELDRERIQSSFRVGDPGGLFFETVPDTCEEFWKQYGDIVVR